MLSHVLPPIIIFLICFMIPLIVHVKSMNINGGIGAFSDFKIHLDLFSWWKANIIFLAGLLSLFAILLSLSSNRINLGKIYKSKVLFSMSLLLYLSFTIYSWLTSQYPQVSKIGFPDRYEGSLVIISYIVFSLFGYLFIRDKNRINAILILSGLCISIMTLIGICQFYNFYPLSETNFGKWLIFGSQAENVTTNSRWKNTGVMFATFFNPNYLGSFCALLSPLFVSNFLSSTRRKITFLSFLVILCTFILAIGSQSRAGLMGIVFSTFMIGYIYYQNKQRYQVRLSILLSIFVFSYLFFGKNMSHRITNMGGKELSNLIINNIFGDYEGLYTHDGRIIIQFSNSDLEVLFENGVIKSFSREVGYIPLKINGAYVNFDHAELKYIHLKLGADKEIGGFVDFYDDRVHLGKFSVGSDGFKELESYEESSIPKISLIPDSLFSNRGYIWSRAIPQIKLLGFGPDTFPLIFPQNDPKRKLKLFNNTKTLVLRPHSLYLQIAHSSGLLGLLSFLSGILCLIYFNFKKLKVPIKNQNDSPIHLGIFFGIIGYLIAGIFNDSIVAIAPIFWLFIGVNFSYVCSLETYKKSETKAKDAVVDF